MPEPAREFLVRRCAEAAGLLVLGAVGAVSLSLATWSVHDPSWNHAVGGTVHNLAGPVGAVVADLVMQVFGIAVVALLPPVFCWGLTLLSRHRLDHARLRLILLAAGTCGATGLASSLPATDRWPLPTGLGGIVGDAVLALPRRLLGPSEPMLMILALVCAGVAILALTAAAGFGLKPAPGEVDDDASAYEWVPVPKPQRSPFDEDADGEPGMGLVSLGAVLHAGLSARAAVGRALRRGRPSEPVAVPSWLEAGPVPAGAAPAGRVEPSFDGPGRPRDEKGRREPSFAPPARDEAERPAPRAAGRPEAVSVLSRMAAAAAPLRAAARRQREFHPGGYDLPSPAILSEPKRLSTTVVSEDALTQNARLLESVLEDFGVRGEIINVRPGPVVTLYELEPAPGIKSSRVIGLADDIARSMSAVSARVAVVQGRNVIGIELPNQRRETVYLRELVGSPDFSESKFKLAVALGKTIGGESVIVDLARMPHLLVAGTTGSGKSVAINTMILSILYRLKPEECRLIMIDPKMLELSVYDGIPHLLTPVVTDPKKAVTALKWAVREMEDRYKKMSKVGVRNIDGFNARVAEALARDESITRTVQTGYDGETGEAVYEREEMSLSVLPYIVVIVDEMADLMMVAGKDIEGAIQRLAQMARAAGIHLIMATQRPSVDVITGTIKANFPTRISFQVTSKIDSRTILGEQGAEQLLGQGDMLHMAGGGRISRVHGPFVSDVEVEGVVAHLKAQGRPDYLDAVVEESDGEPGPGAEPPAPGSLDAEEGADLYDRAVAVVLRDKKCSTSYIQRRLAVGYNKAASLVERMEREGVVAAPNHAGKREVLVGGGADREAFDPEDL
ncbi:DNA translocase FtsK [Lichenibacterium dinghuense]|uniref:DNA translocase FtsK n=1 Tax=Lichenibacterium dinghuense TaxID=2895977 RepID=UPI001F3EA46D|nr:DNA translocase FtsK [Lichenibacterium sp. 6Y81]